MLTTEVTWICRSCGHKHRNADWINTSEPRYCHACGSTAVLPNKDVAAAAAPTPSEDAPDEPVEARKPVAKKSKKKGR